MTKMKIWMTFALFVNLNVLVEPQALLFLFLHHRRHQVKCMYTCHLVDILTLLHYCSGSHIYRYPNQTLTYLKKRHDQEATKEAVGKVEEGKVSKEGHSFYTIVR